MKKIAYFSYKGGAGRSSLAYNTIPMLANKLNATAEKPIVLLDLDIDSAGLTFLLNQADRSTDAYCVQDVVQGRIPGVTRSPQETPLQNHPFFNQLVPVGKMFGLRGVDSDRSILFLPVKTGVNLSFDGTYDQAENHLHEVVRLCNAYGCVALVMDTPTGDQLTARWALDVSKDILVTMKITNQFRQGTISFLKRKDREYCNKNFIIVPNCVPKETIIINGFPYDYEAVKNDIISSTKAAVNNNSINVAMLQNGCFGVPEVRRFKLLESILYALESCSEDELAALKMYDKVVDLLVGENL